MLLVVLSCIILSIGSALHIKNHGATNTYLNILKSQQSSLTTQIQNIKTSITQTQQSIASETDILKKISILQNAILQQKSQLGSLSTTLVSSLNDSSWTCQSFIGTSQNQLGALTSNIINSTNYLSTTVSGLSNSSAIPYFNSDLSAANSTAQTLYKSIYSTGSQVNTVTNTKQTNWLAPNWITGNQTLQNIDQQSLQNQTNNYILMCPLSTPFFDGNQCLGCPTEAPYFNIQTKTCISCTSYDPNTHTCTSTTPVTPEVVYNQSNLAVSLNRSIFPVGFDTSTLSSQGGISCPQSSPFFYNGKCVSCNSPTPLFNYSSGLCTTCPSGSTFIAEKHQCVSTSQVYVTNLPAGSSKMILPEGVKISDIQTQQNNLAASQSVVTCPAETPFYNNVSCISCPNQYFNWQTLSCQSCPSGSTYNQTTFSCFSSIYYSNLNNRNWTSTNPESIRQNAYNASTTPGSTPCPDATPFFDGTKCISCPAGQQYSFDGHKCESCPSGTMFSPNQHSCVQPQIGLYQTNVTTAPALIYDGTSKAEWITIYKQNEQQNPQIADCPSATPYFDGIRCIACPTSHPYFNLRYRLCQICETGSTYDSAVHQCLTQSGDIISQQPNIQKMVASIFT